MRQRLVVAVLAMATALVCAGCGIGPLKGPALPVYNEQKPGETKGPTGPTIPVFTAPKTDLNWRDCGARAFATFGLAAPSPGVLFECATFKVASKERRGLTIDLTAARLSTPLTKPDAAPIVLTTGADILSTRYLAMLASGSPDSSLTEHPIVAVDRRGLADPLGAAMSATPGINCRDELVRRQLVDQAQFQATGSDAFVALADLARKYIGDCPQNMTAEPGAYDVRHAIDDIESLRTTWQVDRLALIGVGDGTSVALTYAHDHPDQIARIVLDSPPPYGSEAEVVGEQRAQGLESTLEAFARQCKALNCALGPDPRGKLEELLAAADSGSLGRSVSKSLLVEHIATVLGLDPQGQADAVASLAQELATVASAAAPAGGTELGAALDDTMGLRFTDGQLIGGCNDRRNQPTPERAKELSQSWSAKEKYPLVGDMVAKSLLECSGWPTGQALDAPRSFPVPVLALYAMYNPVVSSSDPGPIKALISLANATLGLVDWEGIGYSALLRSRCADDTTEKYLNSGDVEAKEGLYCPA